MEVSVLLTSHHILKSDSVTFSEGKLLHLLGDCIILGKVMHSFFVSMPLFHCQFGLVDTLCFCLGFTVPLFVFCLQVAVQTA